MPESICQEPECSEAPLARGYCSRHYQRRLRAGEFARSEPFPVERHRVTDISEDGRSGTCSVCGPARVRPARPGRGAECRNPRSHRKPRTRLTREERIKIKYGIEADEYAVLLDRSAGRCEICGEPFRGAPHVDHDHDSGMVRGLLCLQCNCGIGQLRDSVALLTSAIAYLGRGV